MTATVPVTTAMRSIAEFAAPTLTSQAPAGPLATPPAPRVALSARKCRGKEKGCTLASLLPASSSE